MKLRTIRIGLLAVFASAFLPIAANASSSDGMILTGYAWGENAGWANFAAANGNVHVTDSGLTGYAWDQNYGWINLAPTGAGVTNDGAGNLSGYAWSEGAGWINFSGVTISSSGVFSGTASGSTYGRLNFNCSTCSVTTDWRPASSRTTAPSANPVSVVLGGSAASQQANLRAIYAYNNLPCPESQCGPAARAPAKTAAPPTPISTVSFSRNLQVGAVGTDVKNLQKYLNAHGYVIAHSGPGSPGHETTAFGTLTKLALMRFQRTHKLPVTGFLGPKTRGLISK